MPLPMSHPHQRYSISGYQEDPDAPEDALEVAWSCDLLRFGQSFGLVSDDGTGGANRYSFTDTAHGEEFCAAARELHPAARHPEDRLVAELVTIRQMNSLDQVAYCLDDDRFEELGEHRVAETGRTFEEVRTWLATEFAGRAPRIWDRNASAMVPVAPTR
ncbi:hypothetical protein ACFQ46_22195 [Kineococcus sp. GCM10028916]|uniref:hypothetical protein n=1 Tax=Kineococcus sp. GCM10028916 TaxID=3273394 RepID=UPI0036406589